MNRRAGPLTVISCTAGYHRGGLGLHLSYIIEEARQQAVEAGGSIKYFSSFVNPGDEDIAVTINPRYPAWAVKYTPLRFNIGWLNHLENERLDKCVAKQLTVGMHRFIGVGGQCLRSFRRARELGCNRLEMLAANSHVNNVARQHVAALRKYPLEKSWLSEGQRKKTLLEYEMADQILIASDYSWQTFVAEGVPACKLRRIHFPPDPRYTPGSGNEKSSVVFRIVYVGTLTAVKGVPDLLEAFWRFRSRPAELTLVGGTGGRKMRKFIAEWMERDSRIRLAPGDPLPHLRQANAYVHPAYEDNLPYATLEALHTGVKMIVTSDTGAKEYIRPQDGFIVPTGDWQAILDKLEMLAAREGAPTEPQAAAVVG